MSWLVLRTFALLVGGAALGLLINVAHPHGVRLASYKPATSCVQTTTAQAEATPAPIDVLSPTQVANLCADPRALVVDARTAEEFAEGHVAGAIHLPCASSRGEASAALDLMTGKEILVVYGNQTGDAQPVAEELRSRGGRPDVRYAVLEGGFGAWNRSGFACSSGPCPDCQGTLKP